VIRDALSRAMIPSGPLTTPATIARSPRRGALAASFL